MYTNYYAITSSMTNILYFFKIFCFLSRPILLNRKPAKYVLFFLTCLNNKYAIICNNDKILCKNMQNKIFRVTY